MSNLITDSAVFQSAFEKVCDAIRSVQELHRNGLAVPAEKRAVIAYSDITGASVQAQPLAQWYSAGGINEVIDALVEAELQAITFGPTQPGGRRLNPLPVFGTNILRATGTAHAGANPTLSSVPAVPVDIHGYMFVDEAAMRAMMYRFSRSVFLTDPRAMVVAEDSMFVKAFQYACLRALMRLAWVGDTGGAAGLNMFNGWLKRLDDSVDCGKITTAGTDYLGTIFPALEDAMPDQRHLDQSDTIIATTRAVRRAFMRQVQANNTDERGGYDPVTKELYFNNHRVVGFSDMVATGSKLRAVLTRKANLVLDIVDEPLTIDEDFILSSRCHEFSCPLQAIAVVADTSACAMWTQP